MKNSGQCDFMESFKMDYDPVSNQLICSLEQMKNELSDDAFNASARLIPLQKYLASVHGRSHRLCMGKR